MKAKLNKLLLLFVALSSVAFVACKEDIADTDHYKSPDWLKGNAYEVLQSDGNHTQFLKAVDLSGYQSIVNGHSILTVMAPDDAAFTAFLQKKGYASVEDLFDKNPEYLKSLVGYHLMYYAYDWQKLVNFRPSDGDAATEEQQMVNAGCYYKHRTHSRDAVEQVRVKFTPNATSDTLINIYHYERFLPVFSNKLFETKGIDPAYNYEYFFPETKWATSANSLGTFFVSGAAVNDAAPVVTDNGYLYHVSRVLEPLNTIYDELKNNPDYSKFLKIYDNYSTYTLIDNQTMENLGYQAYQHTHGSLPNIACEWPVNNYLFADALAHDGYNLFVPSNTAIDNFFQTYWTPEGGYTEIDSLDQLILQYFVMQSFTEKSFIVFPEEIKKGDVLTVYGTPININPDAVTDRQMCCNGAFYGMDNMEAPAIFSSVVGPAFSDTSYVNYLYALDASNLVLALASSKSQFVTLVPSNLQFANNEVPMRLYTTTNGKELQQWSDEIGDYTAMGSGQLLEMVNLHTATNIGSLPTTGSAVVATNKPFSYWYVNDGKMTTSVLFNQLLNPLYTEDPFFSITPILHAGQGWSNGSSYAYGYPGIIPTSNDDNLSHVLAIGNDKNYPYYMFSQLLQKAGLIETVNGVEQLNTSINPEPETSRFICFIPTNEALAANISKLPGCSRLKVAEDGTLSGTVSNTNKPLLANYLRSYFINSVINSITAYPYKGSACKGDFITVNNNKMTIGESGDGLQVTLNSEDASKTVNVVSTYHYLPFAYDDGAFHFVDGILE